MMFLKNDRYTVDDVIKGRAGTNDEVKINLEYWTDENLSMFDAVALSHFNFIAEHTNYSIVTTKKSFNRCFALIMGSSERTISRFFSKMIDLGYIDVLDDENAKSQGFIRLISSYHECRMDEILVLAPNIIPEEWMQQCLEFPIERYLNQRGEQ